MLGFLAVPFVSTSYSIPPLALPLPLRLLSPLYLLLAHPPVSSLASYIILILIGFRYISMWEAASGAKRFKY